MITESPITGKNRRSKYRGIADSVDELRSVFDNAFLLLLLADHEAASKRSEIQPFCYKIMDFRTR